MQVDLAAFLAAVIDEAGGELLIPYATFLAQNGEKALTIDLIDDGQTIKLGLMDVKDIPEDVE
jgi:hypothetical protein